MEYDYLLKNHRPEVIDALNEYASGSVEHGLGDLLTPSTLNSCPQRQLLMPAVYHFDSWLGPLKDLRGKGFQKQGYVCLLRPFHLFTSGYPTLQFPHTKSITAAVLTAPPALQPVSALGAGAEVQQGNILHYLTATYHSWMQPIPANQQAIALVALASTVSIKCKESVVNRRKAAFSR
ncbi:hypothetical protein OSTOST_09169, partial [Ostertagia ostertagi]